MERSDKEAGKHGTLILVAIFVLVLGGLFAVGGIVFPGGDIRAIGVGLELQIVGLAIILLKGK